MHNHRAAFLLSLSLAAACDEPDEPDPASTRAASSVTIDPRRSLAVTDVEILEAFPLEKVMDRLVAQSDAPVTSLELHQQWWGAMNAGPAPGPACDDETTGGAASFNGFAWGCPRAEGAAATEDPFTDPLADEAYVPIGLFNRFDLAAADGSHCGEYRIVYARRSGIDDGAARNLVIFEAQLANPDPACGLEGCRPVAEFWAELSAEPKVKKRAAALEHFYFHGLPGFAPVVHVDNLGATIDETGQGRTTGQLRTNQFMQSPWVLREFKLARDCRVECVPGAPPTPAPHQCRLMVVPATVKGNPAGELFESTSADPRQDAFQAHFETQVANLAAPGLNDFFMVIPDGYNPGESVANGTVNDYAARADADFEASVQVALDALGSTLTPRNLETRATAMSCAGCHQRSNNDDLGGGLVWPPSAGFVHVKELGGPIAGPDGPRWAISTALTEVFLPRRQAILEAFLASSGPTCTPGGGGGGPPFTLPLPVCLPDPSGTAGDVEAISDAAEAAGHPPGIGGGRPVH